jgi:hypothetical protein
LNGPWGTTALETHDESGTTVGLDRDAAPGHTYFYRLGASLRNGSPIVFGPISATAERKIARSAIILIGPNPSAGATEIQFAIAGGGNVGMSVVDVAGRLVAKLVEGNYSPGRYSVAWDGAGTSHRLPAGIYFVRLVTRDRVVSRKLAIVR